MNIVQTFLGKFRPHNRVNTPVVLQFSDTECGIAALSMIFSYYGCHVSLDAIRQQCGISRDGTKASTLLRIAQQYGFYAEAYRVDMDAIHKLDKPVIAYWNFRHYVVINGAGHEKVFINDPAYGKYAVTMDEFDKAFTGVIIVITPTESVQKNRSAPNSLYSIWQWCSGLQGELFLLMFALLLLSFFPILHSIITNIFVDFIVVNKLWNWIPYLGGGVTCVCLFMLGSAAFKKRAQLKMVTKASIVKLSELILHALQLPMQYYTLRQKGEFIAILTRAEGVITTLYQSATQSMVQLITAALCFMYMLHFDRCLSILSVFITGLSVFTTMIITKMNADAERYNTHTYGKWHAHTFSTMRNLETIKVCGIEQITLRKWYDLLCQKLSRQDYTNTLNIVLLNTNKFYYAFSAVAFFYLGESRIVSGALTVGMILAYYTIHLFFYNAITVILQQGKDMQKAFASHARIQDIQLESRDQRFLQNNYTSVHDVKMMLELKNVSFSFSSYATPLLKNINLKIYGGQHVAIVGQTGSGKSTLAKLLCGFYPATSGDIYLQSNNIKNISHDNITQRIAYVSQDISLFQGTLLDNMTLWNNNIPHAFIEQAIHIACLEDVIAKRGLYTQVSENGANFSGGEKQRIEIARAFLQGTPILLMDEATSALDYATEMKIISRLRTTNNTIIFIAHRLSTVQHCNEIIVLHHGLLVEKGSHAFLMQQRGYYHSLTQKEMLGHV